MCTRNPSNTPTATMETTNENSANTIKPKFKNSYKDEYDALYEAVFGEGSVDATEDPIKPVEQLKRFKPPDADESAGAAADDRGRRTLLQVRTYRPLPPLLGTAGSEDDDNYDDDQVHPYHRYMERIHREEAAAAAERDQEEDFEESLWSTLPDLLLEDVFAHLTMQQRFYSSLVCKAWNRVFYMANSWRTFVFDDKTLTRRLFNYYSGWQYMLDHLRTQLCLKTIGRHMKTLIFRPINNFYNLYEFMNMISFYAEQQCNPNCMVKGIGSHITCLQYTFPCNMATRNETRLYGTGGKLLDALKRLMSNLPSLRDLRLIDLMLDSYEALQLLDEICYSHCQTMHKLVLINISKTQCQLLHIGVFLNLQELVISPQSLGDDVLHLLADTKLLHLHIVQNSYTPSDVLAVSSKAWKTSVKQNPHLRVHLHVESTKDQSLLWQEYAPVYSILFSSPQIKVQADVIAQCVDFYGKTLAVFGHTGLPRYHQPKSFNERIDSHLMYLSNNCSNLHTLIVRERISTATVLLLSYFSANLKYLYVRRNAVILRNDWPKNPEWTDEFYQWLKSSSQSYEATEREVSIILGCKWKMLQDKEYKLISPKLHIC